MTRSVTTRIVPWVAPSRVFSSLYAESPYSFWLDTSDGSPGNSYVGAGTPQPINHDGVDRLEEVSRLLDEQEGVDTPGLAQGFNLGWVGWFGYELGSDTVGTPAHPSPTPNTALMFVDRAIAFDHASSTTTLMALTDSAADNLDVLGWLDETEKTLSQLDPGEYWADARERTNVALPVRWRHNDAAYLDLVKRCQAAITDGDVFQVCLTNEVSLSVAIDPVQVYLRLRDRMPTHHGGLLRFGDFSLLSASPEQFLRIDAEGLITTRPIKGTRRRGKDFADDALLVRDLLESEKERAENIMIVDLMRNDLTRIAIPGTVEVPELLAVETYSNVHQLVSTVRARKAVATTSFDVVVSCFPPGSMTGAPKHSAMTIIDSLEAGPRGVYSGAFGYVGLDGQTDLAVVIRSIVATPTQTTIGTGGGITALSAPSDELEETHVKIEPLLRAIDGSSGVQVGSDQGSPLVSGLRQ